MNKKIGDLFSDIRFWIILFFLIRLIGITNPPLEIAQNFRQTIVAMVSRNFLEVDNNILYPRIDIAGDKTGITGMEFPILNYLIYLLSEIFGYEHWYGRLINLITSSFGLLYFHKLLIKYFNSKIAFSSTIVLLFSIWFIYSRKIMPDTFSMSFIIASIYYGSNYLDNKSKLFQFQNLLLYFLLVSIGMLSKLPSGYLLVIFLIFIFNKEITTKRKIIFCMVSSISLIAPLIWYFIWVPYLVEKYELWYFFMGNDIIQGINEITQNIIPTLENFYASAIKYIGFCTFTFGFIYAILNKDRKILYVLILTLLSFLIVILKIGHAFHNNGYYIIPFVPVMSLLVGYGLYQIKFKKIALIILIAICLEGVLNQQHDFFINEKQMALLNLEKELDKVSNRKDLILINSNDSPTPLYFSHRKGWILSNDKIKDIEQITNLKAKGLKFIVILKFEPEINIDLPVIVENQNYCIYKI